MDPQNQSPPPSFPPPSGGGAPANPKAKNLAIAMLVLAAAVLIGTFTKSWASAGERGFTVGAGLLGVEACMGDHCKSGSWSEGKAPGDFQLFGWLGFLGGLASAGCAAAIGVFALTNKPNPIPPKVLNIIFGITAFAMTAFFIRLLTEGGKGMSMSYSGFLAIGGIIGVGVVAKQLEKARAGG